MMTESGLLTFGLFAWLFLQWANQDSERQELLDLADRRGVDLDPRRAARAVAAGRGGELARSEEHTSELQSRQYLVCRLLLEKKKKKKIKIMLYIKKKTKP